MELLLVRHGEMAYEESKGIDLDHIHAYANGVKQGPLSDRGSREARRVASRQADEQVDALYASEFIRARETAEPTAEALAQAVEVVADLGELRPGEFDPDRYPSQGRFLKALGHAHRVLPRAIGERRAKGVIGYALIVFFFGNWYRGRTVGGEDRHEALGRARGALELFAERHDSGERVVVFTHGYFIHLLVNHLVDPRGAARRVMRAPYIKNGSITTLSHDASGGWRVKSYAETEHL